MFIEEIKSHFRGYSGAISDYNKVIEMNPKYAEVYYNRAIAKLKLEDYYKQFMITVKQSRLNQNMHRLIQIVELLRGRLEI